MKLWFNGSNPNDAVAERKLEWLVKTHRLGIVTSILDTSGSTHAQNFVKLGFLSTFVTLVLKLGNFWH
jgi:hypothetical protein